MTAAAFRPGDRVDVLFGGQWLPGVVAMTVLQAASLTTTGLAYLVLTDSGEHVTAVAAELRPEPQPDSELKPGDQVRWLRTMNLCEVVHVEGDQVVIRMRYSADWTRLYVACRSDIRPITTEGPNRHD